MTRVPQGTVGQEREIPKITDHKQGSAHPDEITDIQINENGAILLLSPKNVAEELRTVARSKNTRIAYARAWKQFAKYCDTRGIEPERACSKDIAEFFTRLALQPSGATGRPLSLATLKIYRSALNRHYAEAERNSPAATTRVSDVFGGLARLRGHTPRRVKALREHEIKAMLDKCPSGRFGCRDAAMLALGFAAALRRSELCGLAFSDIDILRDNKMVVCIRRSKTDQDGKGQLVAVPEGRTIRPISHLCAWLDLAGIRDGYLFQTFRRGGTPSGKPLNHGEVSRLVKKYATRIGLDSTDYSGHSLRAGFVTSAAAHRARLDKIMEVTRHRNPTTVLQYIRDADAFENHAGANFL